jgi:hypothetical protein
LALSKKENCLTDAKIDLNTGLDELLKEHWTFEIATVERF